MSWVGCQRVPGRGGHQCVLHRRGKHGQAARRAAQRRGNVGAVGVLGEVARPGPEGRQHGAVIGVGREHHDGDLRVPFSKDAGRLDAVQDGHVQVEQDGVGPVLGDQVDGFLAIGGGGHYLMSGRRSSRSTSPWRTLAWSSATTTRKGAGASVTVGLGR